MCTGDFEEKPQSVKKAWQLLPFIMRFDSLSMDNEFRPTVRLIYGTDDVTESQVCSKTLLIK
jgi:hypothetical protein